MSSHCAVQRSSCGSRTSAATAVIAFTASTMRRIVPRLRKSGSSRAMGFCLIIDCIPKPACKHRAGRHAPDRSPAREASATGIVGNPRRRGKLNRIPGLALVRGRARTSVAAALPPLSPCRRTDPIRHGRPQAAARCLRPRRLVRSLRRARFPALVKRYTASVDFDRRLADVDIAGSLAHARMLAAVGVLASDDLAAIERGMDDDHAARSRAASSPGRTTSRTSTSTSRSG